MIEERFCGVNSLSLAITGIEYFNFELRQEIDVELLRSYR